MLIRLVSGGATVNSEYYNGMTALFFAVMKIRNLNHLRLLLEAGAGVNHQSREGTTPLMVALRYGQDEVVDCLLEYGAKIDCVEKDGCTTLMILAERPNDKVLKRLFDSGVDINQKDNQVSTALSIAREHQNILMVIILLRRCDLDNTPERKILEGLHRFSFHASSASPLSENKIRIKNTLEI
jgi:ankyrin repeat protein